MQHVNFETIVKNGNIKIPEKFRGLDDKRVLVEIYDKEIKNPPGKVEKVERFLKKYKGMLKHAKFPGDLDIRDIREDRLKEKYDL
jgi:hypothetical protein